MIIVVRNNYDENITDSQDGFEMLFGIVLFDIFLSGGLVDQFIACNGLYFELISIVLC